MLYRLVRKTMLKTGAVKRKRTKHELGYDVHELRAHLESKFLDGMNWNNYGEWHVDHVKPIEKFRQEGIADIAVINALSNLRPMWARENIQKGAR